MLPNPQGLRTADYIFVRKGAYKMYDLKTISGSSSVGNRFYESIGQTNRVLLNITTEYILLSSKLFRDYFKFWLVFDFNSKKSSYFCYCICPCGCDVI